MLTRDCASSLRQAIEALRPDRLCYLCDNHTRTWAEALMRAVGKNGTLIETPAGDEHKSLPAAADIWTALGKAGATRSSLLVCVGGGMVCDMGAFAASTFKRGIAFILVPTTLLAMVDAAVGGKTGINFGGLKNEIGTFANAQSTVVDPHFLATLDEDNLWSGAAEMLKHALLTSDEMLTSLLNQDFSDTASEAFFALLSENIAVKQRFVTADPTEKGPRKALNLGHTIGHAIEEWALRKGQPLLHGHAVAAGLIGALYLSTTRLGFPTARLRQTSAFIRDHYRPIPITCDDYPTLLALMRHDKKNSGRRICFTLLAEVGRPVVNQVVEGKEIEEALDFYNFTI